MEKLVQQLESNKVAIASLDHRYKETITSVFWNTFKTSNERIEELEWILKIQKRVVNMRHTILENIKLEATKELQLISTKQRDLIAA